MNIDEKSLEISSSDDNLKVMLNIDNSRSSMSAFQWLIKHLFHKNINVT